MLTSIPPALLHRVRDAAAYVHDLAELGLALLCPCDDAHGARLAQLGPDEHLGERCYRPGCFRWITGASDYCSPECEDAAPEPITAGQLAHAFGVDPALLVSDPELLVDTARGHL